MTQLVSSQTFAKALDEIIDSDDNLGLDTETEGLLEKHRLFSIQIATHDTQYYFDFSVNGLLNKEHLLRMSILFGLQHKNWFIVNAKFDMAMLDKEGLTLLGPVYCVGTLERLHTNNYFGYAPYSLASMAKRRKLEKDKGVEEYISKHQVYDLVDVPGKPKPIKEPRFQDVPLDIMIKYGGQDAFLHREIGLDLVTKCSERMFETGQANSFKTVLNNEVELTQVCFKMERKGIKIDRYYATKAMEYEQNQKDMKRAAFLNLTGEVFKDSRLTFVKVFDKFKLNYPTTDKGNPSFSKDALKDIEHPVANLIKEIRRHDKYCSTYYSNFLYMADDKDILRAQINQYGTETGRFSYSGPNLQNVPKEDEGEHEYYVRKSFVPRKGKCFVSIDYSQVEYRIMLDYAGESRLIKQVNEGADVHQATADLLGITRKAAKTVNFAVLYGTGANQLAKMLGIGPDQAREIKRDYLSKLPAVSRLIRNVMDRSISRGYITNWFGRRCHLKDREFAYAMPNHLIQGSCGDIAKAAMVQIYDKLGVTALVNVHDELLFEMKPRHFPLIPRIVDIMVEGAPE
jgi:DNA polymerase-1